MIRIKKAWREMTPEEKCKSLHCNWKYCGENCPRDIINNKRNKEEVR